MNKKILGITIGIIIICVIGAIILFIINNKRAKEDNNSKSNTNEVVENNKDKGESKIQNGKILVVYYSAQSHTKNVANKIAEYLNADTFEITPQEIYTSTDLDWNNNESRVTKEYNDESLRNIKLKTTKVENWDTYDTIIIGYPIWWGIAAWPIDTFVKANNFEVKTVIPFCTSSSSGIGDSGKLLAKKANGGNWLEGHRFNSNASEKDIKDWTDSLKK